MSDRFEIVEFPENKPVPIPGNKIADALADNMEIIISIAKDIVDIQRMKVQSEAVLKKMEADKEMLLAEAEAYVKKKNADTKQIVDKMQVAREILKDFYSQKNTSGVTVEEFSKLISMIFGLTGGG